MKLIPLFLLVGIIAVSGCGKKSLTFSPELVSKAEAGDAKAQGDLGACYYEGKGVTKDYKEAAKWFIKSADQGNAGAEYGLGMCYFCGEGVTKDY